MTLLTILKYPDVRLKKIAKPVAIEDIKSHAIQTMVSDMFETMHQARGIGLAAIQVDINLRIITIDIPEITQKPLCIINPNIIKQQEKVMSNEGCLSFPGIYVNIPRYKIIEIDFYDLNANKQILQAQDLFSFCIQHEIDHLNGKTFFDYLSLLKKSFLTKKLNKQIIVKNNKEL